VFIEQVRLVGLAVRREAAVLALVLACITVFVLLEAFRTGERINFQPLPPIILLALGALAPFAVWKGERIFSGAHLWTLPVERRWHALLKVLAGAVWLLTAVAGLHLWLLGISLVTGGSVGEAETRMLAGPGGIDDLTPVPWSTRPWEWAMPFVAALLAYLFGSALVLGFKHPLRWLAGAVAAFIALLAFDEADLADGLSRFIFDTVITGPMGLEAAIGGAPSREFDGRPPAPGSDASVLVVYYALPSLARTVPAAVLWFALGAAALGVAAWRHRER
jgi:hypothetical protein